MFAICSKKAMSQRAGVIEFLDDGLIEFTRFMRRKEEMAKQ